MPKTSLDFNYVKPCFDLLQFEYNFITLGQKDLFNFNYLPLDLDLLQLLFQQLTL